MKSFIPDHLIEEIRNRADIIEVISEFVPLKSSGKNFKGICPFHSEKTPSFTANREKQIYHCFGCGAGGNVFRFLMAMEDLPFVESVKRLASRYGVSLPERQVSEHERKVASQRDQVLAVNQQAMELFEANLQHPAKGKAAREYFARRGLSEDTIKRFHLGWAPDEWRVLLNAFTANGNFSKDFLVDAGLIAKKEKEGGENAYYDRFRGRVLFPIHDTQGRLIGFGGRIIGEGEPKYLNTPETVVYKKGNFLYGLHLARQAIQKENRVIIVEGYMDQLRAFDAGIENTVATCGTALTPNQARAMYPYSKEAVLVFDPDAAGQAAAEKGFEVLLDQGFQVNVVTLPDGQDPDAFIHANGADAFRQQVDSAKPFIIHLLDRELAEQKPNDPRSKVNVVNRILPFLIRIKHGVERAEWIRQITEKLGIEDRAFLDELKRASERNRPRMDTSPVPRSSKAFDTEWFLIQIMLADTEAARMVHEQVSLDMFLDPDFKETAGMMFAEMDAGKPLRVDRLLDETESKEIKSILSRVALTPMEFDPILRATSECIGRLKRRQVEDQIKQLKQQRNEAVQAGNPEKSRELQNQVKKMEEALVL